MMQRPISSFLRDFYLSLCRSFLPFVAEAISLSLSNLPFDAQESIIGNILPVDAEDSIISNVLPVVAGDCMIGELSFLQHTC